MSGHPRVVVRWLTAQTFAFGFTAAVLGVAANALFLSAYGPSWLPLTYVFIALVGLGLSGAVARAARRWSLVRIEVVVLGGSAAAFAASWAVAAGTDGAWVSAPLLVLFPVWIQLGFVFVGSQAGRLLDLGGIKASFPRIVAGFPVGAIVGGVAAGALVSATGRVEHLLLATALAQAAYLALALATARPYRAELTRVEQPPAPGAAPVERSGAILRTLVLGLFGYQVLSAVGSQLADFLVFDRAAARYGDGEELAAFIARYTAVMNVVSVAFLALAAGLLLRRFGLRLGLVANPGVLAAFALAMVAALAVGGAGSSALFAVVALARIADIALTDGTTRTSINAAYQLVPDRERLVVQAQVEGIGVPLAIGFSGVLVLVLDALPASTTTIVVATLVVCVVWTVVAVAVYRSYTGGLRDAIVERRVLDEGTLDDEAELAAARRLLRAGDAEDVRLGLDLVAGIASPADTAEISRLSSDPRLDVRLAALAERSARGELDARSQLAAEIAIALRAGDATARTVALDALDGVDDVDDDTVDAVLDALDDPATRPAAARAVGRLGDRAGPAAAGRLAALATGPAPTGPAARRLVAALTAASGEEVEAVLRGLLDGPDRELGLTALRALARPGPAGPAVAADVRRVLGTDAADAARLRAAAAALVEHPVVHRALVDELELVRARVGASLVVLYGSDRLGDAVTALSRSGPGRALAVEAVTVTVSHTDAALAGAVLEGGEPGADATITPSRWLAEIVEDGGGHWRSAWLRACALHVALDEGIEVPDGLDGDVVALAVAHA